MVGPEAQHKAAELTCPRRCPECRAPLLAAGQSGGFASASQQSGRPRLAKAAELAVAALPGGGRPAKLQQL
ncbi:hypothetical protein WJX81_002739 [Elliptochloris bilobata]|uniref:Uncharacterized protein n=1 Tax=Elliptochloris bilobata TaxID=381761 RepID=A0AAW1S7S0_9CHLO